MDRASAPPPEPALVGPHDSEDVLRAPGAGTKVVRGGAVRGAGYAVGVLLGAVASVFLLRHLGVIDFGRYVTVMSLIGIVGGVTDAGLTVVGSRELAVRPVGDERRRLVANIVAIRLLLTPLGVAGAVLFALVAGYDGRLVLGTLLAGAGLVLVNAQASMMLPLAVELRNARLAIAELVKQAVTAGGIVVLAAAGAALLPFFAVQVLVGLVILAATPALLGRRGLIFPHADRLEWRMLAGQALPVAAAFILGILYFRVLVIMTSLIATERETGLFATSFRIFELLVGIPLLLVGVVLPVVSAAAHDDERRLRYVVQRVTEVALICAVGLSLVVAIAAEPVIVLLGGEEFREAAPILRIQVFALVGIFLSQAWFIALIAIRRQSAVALASALGLAAVMALGFVLIGPLEATGSAIAALVADLLLAALALLFLRRHGPGHSLSFAFVPKVALAAGAAAALVLIPGVSRLVVAVVAGLVYGLVVWATRALPPEVLDAFPAERLRWWLRPAGR